MANFVPGNLDLQISIYTVYGVQTAINVLAYKAQNAATPQVDLESVLDKFNTYFLSAYVDILPTDAQVWGYKVQVWPTNTKYHITYYKGQDNTSWKGTVTGGVLPLQCASVQTLQTYGGGKSSHGRIYLPFLPLSMYNQTNAYMGALYRDQALAMMNGIKTIQNVDPLNPWQYKMGVAHRSTGTVDEVRLCSINASIGTQQRRGSYGKANRPPY